MGGQDAHFLSQASVKGIGQRGEGEEETGGAGGGGAAGAGTFLLSLPDLKHLGMFTGMVKKKKKPSWHCDCIIEALPFKM